MTRTDEIVKHAELTDEELIQRLRQGDRCEPELFDHIFARYQNRVVAWCYRFTRDRELSLDLAQEIFLKVYRRFHTFRSDAKLSTWLYSITRNHCFDAVQRKATDMTDPTDMSLLRLCDPNMLNIETDIGNRQERSALLRVVKQSLNETEARVMALHYGHDVPINTVTAILSLQNASGAKAFIVSARRKLSVATRTLRYAC